MQDLFGKGKEGNCLDREGFHEVSAHTALQIAIKLDNDTLPIPILIKFPSFPSRSGYDRRVDT